MPKIHLIQDGDKVTNFRNTSITPSSITSPVANPMPKNHLMLLTNDAKRRLFNLLETSVSAIPNRAKEEILPGVKVRVPQLLLAIWRAVEELPGLKIRSLKLSGGASRAILNRTFQANFQDIDFVFYLDGITAMNSHGSLASSSESSYSRLELSAGSDSPDPFGQPRQESVLMAQASMDWVKRVFKGELFKMFVQSGLFRNLSKDVNITKFYISKQVLVLTADIWSMFSIRGASGRNIEIKFVYRLARGFQFPVDAFQIGLSLESLSHFSPWGASHELSFLRERIEVSCLSGDTQAALNDLHNLILTPIHPDLVFGGCLLKYAQLRREGFRLAALFESASEETLATMKEKHPETLMLTRFVVDYPDQASQASAVSNYLITHCAGESLPRQIHLVALLMRIVSREWRRSKWKQLDGFRKVLKWNFLKPMNQQMAMLRPTVDGKILQAVDELLKTRVGKGLNDQTQIRFVPFSQLAGSMPAAPFSQLAGSMPAARLAPRQAARPARKADHHHQPEMDALTRSLLGMVDGSPSPIHPGQEGAEDGLGFQTKCGQITIPPCTGRQRKKGNLWATNDLIQTLKAKKARGATPSGPTPAGPAAKPRPSGWSDAIDTRASPTLAVGPEQSGPPPAPNQYETPGRTDRKRSPSWADLLRN